MLVDEEDDDDEVVVVVVGVAGMGDSNEGGTTLVVGDDVSSVGVICGVSVVIISKMGAEMGDSSVTAGVGAMVIATIAV